MEAASREAIVFAGAPDALEALVPVPPSMRASIRVVLDERCADLAPTVLTSGIDQRTTLVRLVGNPTAAPGTFEARVLSDAGELPALVEVVAQHTLTFRPPSLAYRMAPGGSASVRLTVENTGNAAVALRRLYAVGLLEDGAVDTAVGYGLRMRERPPGVSRFELAGDKLAERYAGAARLHVEGFDEPISPGGTGTGVARLALDDRARGGCRYHGLWHVEGSRVPVTVVTSKAEPVPKRASKKKTVEEQRDPLESPTTER